MQKVLRRTELAKRQATRKKRILEDRLTRRDRREKLNNDQYLHGQFQKQIKYAKRATRRDWELGPLSPLKGDKALMGAVEPMYGSISAETRSRTNAPLAEKDRKKEYFIKAGDRVCLVDGPERVKGKIGRVLYIAKESDRILVEGVNRFEVCEEKEFLSPTQQRFQTMELPMPTAWARLVYPLPNPTTGIPQDTIINHMVKRDQYVDPYANKVRWSRVVMPQNMRIPWPEDAPSERPENQETHASDTRRIDVEDATFLPTLLRPPMPLGVIDELRNRFSVFRTRHDPAWVAAKVAEDAAEAAREAQMQRMVPRGARNLARARSTSGGEFMRSSAPVVLSDEMWSAIGAHMERRGISPVAQRAKASSSSEAGGEKEIESRRRAAERAMAPIVERTQAVKLNESPEMLEADRYILSDEQSLEESNASRQRKEDER